MPIALAPAHTGGLPLPPFLVVMEVEGPVALVEVVVAMAIRVVAVAGLGVLAAELTPLGMVVVMTTVATAFVPLGAGGTRTTGLEARTASAGPAAAVTPWRRRRWRRRRWR